MRGLMKWMFWAWLLLLGWSALLATAAQYAFFRTDSKPNNYDLVFIAGARCSVVSPRTFGIPDSVRSSTA